MSEYNDALDQTRVAFVLNSETQYLKPAVPQIEGLQNSNNPARTVTN
jgi:hypothetical protein